MNYFEHHIGDYAAATAHLSWDEDMAYTRLIRAYYHHERAIPEGEAYRLARATSAAQRKAVDTVLKEFFRLDDGAYHQKRCDSEVVRYHDKQAKAKRSAEARWSAQPSHTERNANAMRTHSEGNAPNHQTPDTTTEAKLPTSAADAAKRPAKKCPADFVVTDEMRAWAAEKTPGVDVEAETESFRDNTFGVARVDWPGTWRNWMRTAQKAIRRVNGTTYREQDALAKRKRIAEMTGGILGGEVIDMEATNAPRIANG